MWSIITIQYAVVIDNMWSIMTIQYAVVIDNMWGIIKFQAVSSIIIMLLLLIHVRIK